MTDLDGRFIPPNIAALMNKDDRKEFGLESEPEDAKSGEKQNAHDKASEKVLQGLCDSALSLRSIEGLHLSYKAREKKGWPDLVFAINGQAIAVELKVGKNKLSEDQERVRAALVANGWHYYVVRTYDEFVAVLTKEQEGV